MNEYKHFVIKELKPKWYYTYFEHFADVARIMEICLRHGYHITPTNAMVIWDKYSSEQGMDWAALPRRDDWVWGVVKDNSVVFQ